MGKKGAGSGSGWGGHSCQADWSCLAHALQDWRLPPPGGSCRGQGNHRGQALEASPRPDRPGSI